MRSRKAIKSHFKLLKSRSILKILVSIERSNANVSLSPSRSNSPDSDLPLLPLEPCSSSLHISLFVSIAAKFCTVLDEISGIFSFDSCTTFSRTEIDFTPK